MTQRLNLPADHHVTCGEPPIWWWPMKLKPLAVDGKRIMQLVGPCPTCIDRSEWCGFGDGLPDDDETCSAGTVPLARVTITLLPVVECVAIGADFRDFKPNPAILYKPDNVYSVGPHLIDGTRNVPLDFPFKVEPGTWVVRAEEVTP